jgi:3-phenylpropionate/trans-cinnamate dioxygenase ferredoxin reductase subunit
MTDGMVIVGAGEAGARAASALRAQGFGGPVTIVGDEAHAPYERPPLSKAVLVAHGGQPAPTAIFDEAWLGSQRIAYIVGQRALSIDRSRQTVMLADGRFLAYSRLLVATGAVAAARVKER